jgi:hypothetical protein
LKLTNVSEVLGAFITLATVAERTSEMSVNFNKTTQHYNQEASHHLN